MRDSFANRLATSRNYRLHVHGFRHFVLFGLSCTFILCVMVLQAETVHILLRETHFVRRKGVWASVIVRAWTCKELKTKQYQTSRYLRPGGARFVLFRDVFRFVSLLESIASLLAVCFVVFSFLIVPPRTVHILLAWPKLVPFSKQQLHINFHYRNQVEPPTYSWPCPCPAAAASGGRVIMILRCMVHHVYIYIYIYI